jgi:putative thioredoxin
MSSTAGPEPASSIASSILDVVIRDVTEATFEQDVIERSKEVPVVVDFWAEWCGPCRQLTPVLEKAATDRDGQVDLAKLDTDANQRLSAAFRIQGIPAVKAFKDGKVVDEFVGAQPPQAVERFFDSLVPSEADGLVEAGDEASLRRALELEPANGDAALRLARILHERGEDDEALASLANVAGHFGAEGLAARIRLERTDDVDVGAAFEALDAGDHERALAELIAVIPGSGGHKDDLRRAVVGILDELGAESELARDARRRLASALY